MDTMKNEAQHSNREETMDAQTAWNQISIGTKMACGARNAMSGDDHLTFQVESKPHRYIEIKLCCDLYSVRYFRLKRSTYEHIEIESAEGIYADMLSDVIYHMVNK